MAVADVFDAMISRRVYKPPIPMPDVRSAMAEQRGRHFDPDLLDAFLGDYEAFCDIARAHPDEPATPAPLAAG
jgi:putative two-component system response regulator